MSDSFNLKKFDEVLPEGLSVKIQEKTPQNQEKKLSQPQQKPQQKLQPIQEEIIRKQPPLKPINGSFKPIHKPIQQKAVIMSKQPQTTPQTPRISSQGHIEQTSQIQQQIQKMQPQQTSRLQQKIKRIKFTFLPKEKTIRTKIIKRNMLEISYLFFGRFKVGKTIFASNFNHNRALFLATDPGQNHIDNPRININSWEEMLLIYDELVIYCQELKIRQAQAVTEKEIEDAKGYGAIVLDTADIAYKLVAKFILEKLKLQHESDAGYAKAWSMCRDEFMSLIRKLAQLPLCLVILSHETNKGLENTNKEILPNLPKRVTDELMGFVDVNLRFDRAFCPKRNKEGGFMKDSNGQIIREEKEKFFIWSEPGTDFNGDKFAGSGRYDFPFIFSTNFKYFKNLFPVSSNPSKF